MELETMDIVMMLKGTGAPPEQSYAPLVYRNDAGDTEWDEEELLKLSDEDLMDLYEEIKSEYGY